MTKICPAILMCVMMLVTSHTSFGITTAHAKGKTGPFATCMKSCRAQAKACFQSGQTGNCKKQQISCFASCQSTIKRPFVKDPYKNRKY